MSLHCHYRGRVCDTVLASFNPDDWLRCEGQAGHLFDGLAWLLRAAQEWQIQSEMNLHLDGYSVQVLAMDSVFLRARSLFEFFIGKGKNYCHAHCLFGLNNQLEYPAYAVRDGTKHVDLWEHVLHAGSLHIQDRGGYLPLTGHDGISSKDLNQMPVDIAKGILDVWRDFEEALRRNGHKDNYQKALDCRKKAARNAAKIIESVGKRADAYKKACFSHASLTTLFENQQV